VMETDEEPVVSKTARVKEEVVVHKEATDRAETVRDTVRRQDVEIDRDDNSTTHAGGTTPMPTTTARPKI
jgi:stress response protein YsnF